MTMSISTDVCQQACRHASLCVLCAHALGMLAEYAYHPECPQLLMIRWSNVDVASTVEALV